MNDMKLQALFSLRTNNFNDPKIIDKVTDLWDTALEKLSDHDGSIFGVYHNYDSNYRGDYDLSIAIATDQPAHGTIQLGQHYREFKISLNQPSSIVEAWHAIWAMEDKGDLQRQYDADYEEYRPNGTVSIFISLKP